MTDNPFASADVISVYTQEQAIEDGVLIRVPNGLREAAGFKIPVVITVGLHDIISNVERGEDYTGRLWDVLNVSRLRVAKAVREDSEDWGWGPFEFTVTFAGRNHTLWIAFNPNEGFTIMRPEDY